MFDGAFGNYTDTCCKIELLERAQPYHAKLFLILKIHEEILKSELDRLVNTGVLKYKNNSEQAAPIFIIPQKNGIVCFISSCRELNKTMKSKSFPIPKIKYLLLKLETQIWVIVMLSYTLSQETYV